MKHNLGVVFGGKSCEHDVSIITGHQFIQNADRNKYDFIPIYITREGKWFTGPKVMDMEFLNNFNPNDDGVCEVYLSPTSGNHELVELEPKKGMFGGSKARTFQIDVVVLALHGLHGEDGTVAGLLELANIPYGNTGVMGSAVGMDKIIMKSVFKSHGFPVLDDLYFERNDFSKNADTILEKVSSTLGFPVFVKPANLGSSIGISKATDKESLKEAMHVAFSYDRRVLIEKGVSNLTEINCSCLGYSNAVAASVCEMPVSWQEFLTFEDKYLRGGKGAKGMESLSRQIPAPISDSQTAYIQDLSKKIFMALDCKGVVRIDYLIDKETDKVYIGEINTQPGSFSFYLWEPAGLPYNQLIDKLVEIAFLAQKDKDKNNFAFDSDILTKVNLGGKSGGKTGSKR